MIIELITIYLIFIFAVLIYSVLIWVRIIKHEQLIPLTFTILGILTLIFGLIVIWKGNSLIFDLLGLISLGIGIFAIGIALFTFGKSEESQRISEESRARMITIGDGEIQQSIINIEGIRKDYFYDLQEHLFTPLVNRNPINLGRLQQINIFTTWLHLENIRKAIIYKKYMTDTQQTKFFRLHRTLLDNVIDKWEFGMVSNESILQLLTGIQILYENLTDTQNFIEKFYEILNEYIGYIEPDETFLEYINRKKEEISRRDVNALFEPFQ